MSDTVKAAEEKPDLVRPAKAPRAAALKEQLEAEKASLEAELAPARAAYDRLINAPELLAARAKIKEVSAKLAPILNELAALARAGGARGIKAEAGQFSAKEGT